MAPGVTSVIVPMLNGARFVGESLDSARRQLSGHDEIIVVDNGSTDASIAVVEAIGDPRIRIIEEARSGPAATRNAGLRQARGAFVAFLDCDDLWPENRHPALLKILNDDPACDGAYGRVRVLFDGPLDPRFAHLDGVHTARVLLHPFLFRRSILDRVGPFNEAMATGEDSDLLVRMAEIGARFAVYDGDAGIYRRHDANMTLKQGAIKAGVMGALAQKLKRKHQ